MYIYNSIYRILYIYIAMVSKQSILPIKDPAHDWVNFQLPLNSKSMQDVPQPWWDGFSYQRYTCNVMQCNVI